MVVKIISSQDIGLLQKDSAIFLNFQIVHDKSFGVGSFCS